MTTTNVVEFEMNKKIILDQKTTLDRLMDVLHFFEVAESQFGHKMSLTCHCFHKSRFIVNSFCGVGKNETTLLNFQVPTSAQNQHNKHVYNKHRQMSPEQ